MLIQFSVQNFRSIRDPLVLNMTASKAIRRLKETNTFSTGRTEASLPNLLKSVAMYGPNASGKSNFVKALKFVEQLVLRSAKADVDNPIPVSPFKLDRESIQSDTQFEIDFIEEGIRFNYQISCNETRITHESLVAYPKSRPQLYYERKFSAEAGKDEYVFGTSLEGGRLRHDWARQTGRNTLYLSRAVQQSAEDLRQLRIPFNWFNYRLRIISANRSSGIGNSRTVRACHTGEKEQILEFLNSADIPIADIKVEFQKFDPSSIPPDMPAGFRDGIIEVLSGEQIAEVSFYHRSTNGELVEFSEKDESDGTLSLFSFAGPWSDVLNKELVLIVDEIDTSLHPMVVHKLIQMLHHSDCKAQLLFTTHDTSIMSTKFLRRDQYYFVERDSTGASILKPMLAYKGREEDPLEKLYMSGVFGGTPILRRIRHVR